MGLFPCYINCIGTSEIYERTYSIIMLLLIYQPAVTSITNVILLSFSEYDKTV